LFLEIIVILVIALSTGLSGLMGFGGALLAIPILAIFLPVSQAINLMLLFSFMTGFLAFFNYKSLDWNIFKTVSIGAIIGVIIGTLIQIYMPEQIVSFLLGLIVLLYVLKNRIKNNLVHSFIMKLPKTIIGLLAGFIQGGFGTGGPILVIYYNEVIKDKVSFRATLISSFFILNIIRLVISTYSGLITYNILILASYAMPTFLLSLFLSQKYHIKLNEDLFKKIVDILLFFSSIHLLVKGFI